MPIYPFPSSYRCVGFPVPNTMIPYVRKLPKPNRALLLMKATADCLEEYLIFGTLPGWWLGEKRKLDESECTARNLEADFQSARVMLSTASTPVQASSTIVSLQISSATSNKRYGCNIFPVPFNRALAHLRPLYDLRMSNHCQFVVCIFTANM